jgi:predicted DNA-binding transcriptional regulator AlpA
MTTHDATTQAPAAALPKFLKASEAATLFRVSEGTFVKNAQNGTWPKPVYLTPRRPVWRERDLVSFLNSL